MKNGITYYFKLDVIRVLSCLIVILYHLNIAPAGFLIVCTFFVLSGYLEGLSAFKNNDFSIKKYYQKRFVRLYLPLLFVVFLTLIVAFFTDNIWIDFKQEMISSLLGYNNFWQLQAKNNYFAKHIHSPIVHLWYISILMQYDLVFPIVLKLVKKLSEIIHKNVSVLIFAILSIITTILFYFVGKNVDTMTMYYSSSLRSFSFVLGVLLAVYQYHSRYRLSSFFHKFVDGVFIIYLTVLASICFFVLKDPTYYVLNMIIVTLLSCRLIEYATLKENKRNIMTNIISYLSNISYEIYLVHFPIIFFMQKIKVNTFFRSLLIFTFSIIISSFLHYLLTFRKEEKNRSIIKKIFIGVIVFLGGALFIIQNDPKKDLVELEKSLIDKTKMMEQKNQEYMDNTLKENEEFEKMLENMALEEQDAVLKQLVEIPIVGIGDSVFLDAIDKLYRKFPNGYFDGKVSRSLIAGLDILADLKANNRLPNHVILALSTNGYYSERQNKKLMEIVENRDIYWVNSVGADDPKFNDRFEEFAKNYPNIHIVDWEGAALGHSEYFYADGIHPKGLGIDVYVNTIYDTIYNNSMKKYKDKKNELLLQKEADEKKKITFYGNDILVNSYDLLYNKFDKSAFVANTNNDFEKVYHDVSEKVNRKVLEYKIVFLFDKEISISKKEYQKLIDLCAGHEIYVCNFTLKDLSFSSDSVQVIDFYDELKKHDEYLLPDKVHLSKKGIDALGEKLFVELNK